MELLHEANVAYSFCFRDFVPSAAVDCEDNEGQWLAASTTQVTPGGCSRGVNDKHRLHTSSQPILATSFSSLVRLLLPPSHPFPSEPCLASRNEVFMNMRRPFVPAQRVVNAVATLATQSRGAEVDLRRQHLLLQQHQMERVEHVWAYHMLLYFIDRIVEHIVEIMIIILLAHCLL